MELSSLDRRLAALAAEGLPLEARPYAALGRSAGLDEAAVIDGLHRLLADGTVKRLGIVVRHRELGYRANAMVVWDVPDDRVGAVGASLSALPFVTLCYRRPRRLPLWPYNLFCMVHGRDRATVSTQINQAIWDLELGAFHHDVLFSRRCFKQRGARYRAES